MANNEKDVNKKNGHYFKDMKAELKKVVWPSPKQTANNTIAVIVFALAIAIIVFALDSVFNAIYKYGVTPVQEKITSSYSEKTDENSEITTTEDDSADDSEELDEDDGFVVNATSDDDSIGNVTAEISSDKDEENVETNTKSHE